MRNHWHSHNILRAWSSEGCGWFQVTQKCPHIIFLREKSFNLLFSNEHKMVIYLRKTMFRGIQVVLFGHVWTFSSHLSGLTYKVKILVLFATTGNHPHFGPPMSKSLTPCHPTPTTCILTNLNHTQPLKNMLVWQPKFEPLLFLFSRLY